MKKAPAIERLELHVVYQCVNDCVFCSERDHMREFSAHPATMAEIEELLERKRGAGCRHVTFTGGEPTLFPKIWRAFEKAKALGYRTFLVTNGSALALDDFAAAALPHLDEICLSLHGPDAAAHEGLTRNPKSFARLERAFANIQSHPGPHFLMINCVVNRENVNQLAGILRFAAGCGKLRQALFSYPAPLGAARERYAELAPRLGELSARLPELVRIAAEKDVVLRIGGVPACALGERWECSDDLYFSPRLTVSRTKTADGGVGWFEEEERRPGRERFHPAGCGPCSLRGRCGGVYKAYWDKIEQVELKPFAGEGACRS
ncbi:MAG: radical SAM protein [Elusimicrobiota bacterium]